MDDMKAMLASACLMIGLLLGVNAMVRPEKDDNLLMWAILFLIAALGFWFWMMREQRTAEEVAEDALDAAEGIKKKVEIKSADEKTEVKVEPAHAPKPAPSPEPRAAAPTPPPAPTPRPEPDAPAPAPTKKAAKKAEPDDLTRIEGIGPKMAELLIAAGIDTFAKLAAMSEDAITETIKTGGGRKSASMGTWAEQAKLAAAGDWDGLASLQARLTGGRK